MSFLRLIILKGMGMLSLILIRSLNLHTRLYCNIIVCATNSSWLHTCGHPDLHWLGSPEGRGEPAEEVVQDQGDTRGARQQATGRPRPREKLD